MNVVIVVSIILVALFALAFFTKRRFGVLGLALAAGAMLSELWAAELTPFVQKAGFVREAYFRENYYLRGAFADTAVYSLLEKDLFGPQSATKDTRSTQRSW